MEALFIVGKRNGYCIEQCGKTLTVGELKEELDNYDDDLPIYLNNDNRYTFGSITSYDISVCDTEEEDY